MGIKHFHPLINLVAGKITVLHCQFMTPGIGYAFFRCQEPAHELTRRHDPRTESTHGRSQGPIIGDCDNPFLSLLSLHGLGHQIVGLEARAAPAQAQAVTGCGLAADTTVHEEQSTFAMFAQTMRQKFYGLVLGCDNVGAASKHDTGSLPRVKEVEAVNPDLAADVHARIIGHAFFFAIGSPDEIHFHFFAHALHCQSMSKFEIADWLRYSCIGCGACCRRGYDIWCPPKDYPRLSEIDWAGKYPQLRNKRLFMPQSHGYRFNLDETGACLFLDKDNRCLMHGAIGFDRKVLTCKMYPFNLVHSFGRVHVGLLFSCPAVVDRVGDPVRAQTGLLNKLLAEMDELFAPPEFAEETSLDGWRNISFRNLRFLEEALCMALADESLTFLRRLLWAAQILDRIDESTDEQLHAKNFHNTLQHHRDRARDEAENCGIARPEISRFERLLLRQFQGFSTSLAERGLTSSSFMTRTRARLRRAGLALRYLYGGGKVPGVDNIDFASARKVRCLHLPENSRELLSRYLRTRFMARMYFGSEGWGLPVLQGARMILTLPAVVLWHAKVLAAVEGADEVAHEHVRAAVLLVDNAFGHMAGLRTGSSRRALELVSRAGWPQKAVLDTMV